MPDPKLVEALAQLICHQTVSDEAPVGCRDCERAAREFFAEHRLIQLPEEPDGYITPADLRCVRDQTLPGAPHVTLWNRKNPGDSPVYIFPGDPQEVDDG